MNRSEGTVAGKATTQIPFRKFPGIMATADGAGAAVWAESHVAQMACSFPVQPAQAMQEAFGDLAAGGARNVFQEVLEVAAAESPADAASTCEGYTLTGGRATSFVSGQALPAMSEVLTTIAGRRLPLVFHVGARALQSQGTATLAGHDDVMSVAETGWAIVFAKDPQQVVDLALICRRAAEYAETPFLVVQDAYATTHQIRDILLPEPELMRLFLGEAEVKVKDHFNPRRPTMLNPVQDDASYMEGRLAQRKFLSRTQAALEASMEEFGRLTGRIYQAAEGYRLEEAEHLILGCGSMMEAAQEAVDQLRGTGTKAGAITLNAFRPFPDARLAEMLKGRRSVTVFERTDTPLAPANPVTLGVRHAMAALPNGAPMVFSAVAGLGTLAVEASAFVAAVENAVGPEPQPLLLLDALESGDGDAPDANAQATGLVLQRSGGSGGAEAMRLIAGITRAVYGVRVDAEGYVGTEKVGKPQSYRLAAGAQGRPLARRVKAKLCVVQNRGLLYATNPLRDVADGGVLFCPFASSVEAVWRLMPSPVKQEVQQRDIRLAGLEARHFEELQHTLLPFVEADDLLALGAWLRISPFQRERQLPEEQVKEAMLGYFAKAYPGIRPNESEELYRWAKSIYLGMLRFATPAEPVEIPSVLSLPVMTASTVVSAEPGEDADNFCEQLIGTGACPNRGDGWRADQSARAQAEPAVALVRSFRNDAPAIPVIDMERCVGCMECVALCPDVAILGRVTEEDVLASRLQAVDDATERALLSTRFGRTRRYFEAPKERGQAGGMLGLFVDADRCKGCGECVEACGENHAIVMAPKSDVDMAAFDQGLQFYRSLPDTPAHYLIERSLGDLLLSERSQLAVGGSGSCAGCGQSTAVRLVLASTGFQFGAENVGVVAASGCDSVYGAVFPYNPFRVPWTNTLSDNAPADALGIRRRWNREGHRQRKVWVLGSMENFGGAGLSALTALLASGEDVNVLVLDSQIFHADSRRVHAAGYVSENRASGLEDAAPLRPAPDLAQLAMVFPNVFVAQTTASHLNHFQRSIRGANEFPGPALVVCYATCMAEDGVPEDSALAQAKLAVESRAFPLLQFDPRAGDTLRDRLNLQGNPAPRDDWYTPRGDGEALDFVGFAATETRFAPYFNDEGEPLPALLSASQDRLAHWRRLQEMAGFR
jgi:pyruvate/2-oxoacid:ferredoxin oxidoreductase alpha subunit/pyruvate/2-oxoacid:ferredoxin oxidoreductase beta subunit/Pyruvate/2-oxoacid:ferredoxin oxidoreductase delta subunit